MLSGIVGVPLGAYLAQRLRKKHPRADPVICGFGLLISAPCLVASMLLVSVNAPAAYCLIFIGEIALNLNWAIVADILLVRINKLSIYQTFCTYVVNGNGFISNSLFILTMFLLNHTFFYSIDDLTNAMYKCTFFIFIAIKWYKQFVR